MSDGWGEMRRPHDANTVLSLDAASRMTGRSARCFLLDFPGRPLGVVDGRLRWKCEELRRWLDNTMPSPFDDSSYTAERESTAKIVKDHAVYRKLSNPRRIYHKDRDASIDRSFPDGLFTLREAARFSKRSMSQFLRDCPIAPIVTLDDFYRWPAVEVKGWITGLVSRRTRALTLEEARTEVGLLYLARLGMTETEEFVYFVQAGDFIKIGISADPIARFKALGTASPTPIDPLVAFIGSRQVELKLHGMFSTLRTRREWFRADPSIFDLVSFIEENDLFGILQRVRLIEARLDWSEAA